MRGYSFKADPRIADWEREKLREFCSSLEGDMVGLSNSFGLKVRTAALLPYERGYLENEPSFGSSSGWVINVNQSDRPEVQNFTVAHELGHFVLHKAHLAQCDIFDGRMNREMPSAKEPFSYLAPQDQQMEVEANLFAASLLMPSNQFKPAFERFSGDRAALAKLFFVTESAVRRRVLELGLS